jgi:uncharacterized membrane protein
MAAGLPWWLLPRQVRDLPADLVAVVLWIGFTFLAVFLPGVRETPIRVVFGLPLVLFVPGYALIAALFPEAGEVPASDAEEGDSESHTGNAPSETRAGIDGIERVALSFGLSIAVVPLLGLVLNFTPWGIRLVPIMVAVCGATLVFTAVAAKQRWALPPEERFQVPYTQWLSAARTEMLEPETKTDGALNVLLAISVLLAVASVGYAVTVPQKGESFSELYLLTESEDGDLVADDYPTEYTRGEGRSLIVGIGNHEYERVNYTLVVTLQRVAFTANNTTQVLEEDRLRQFRVQIGHNETRHIEHTITPTFSGQRLRLTYLLYRGQPPGEPTIENAYRENHLWINVSTPGG